MSSFRFVRKCYHSGPGSILRKPTVASVKTHTMGSLLSEYLHMKVHSDIQNNTWARIIVKAEHQRDPSMIRISPIKKRDKPSTGNVPQPQLLTPRRFIYIVSLVSTTCNTMLRSQLHTSLWKAQTDRDVVQYTLPTPSECLKPLLNSNLAEMGAVDIVIVGYVHGLERWTKGLWEGDNSDKLFSWKKITSQRGYSIAFLGCRVIFWGDITGNMVRALQKLNNAKCVLYVGKSGSLRANKYPTSGLRRVTRA